MKVGQKIKQARETLGISADQVAECVGVHRSTVFRWERGASEKMTFETFFRLCVVLQITPNYLLGWDVKKCST